MVNYTAAHRTNSFKTDLLIFYGRVSIFACQALSICSPMAAQVSRCRDKLPVTFDRQKIVLSPLIDFV